MSTLVLVDANNECYRSFYSTGGLSHGGDATGVVYGFMRTVKDLEARFPLCRLVFAWDYGKGKREIEYPWYKATRRAKRKEERRDPVKKKMFEGFEKQVARLRDKLLTRAGYRNVFKADGYEADDIISQVVLQERGFSTSRIVIVSGDQDFYQLLGNNIVVYHPRNDQTITHHWLTDKFGIAPKDWVKVKAIAGCKSDDIPGIHGIGEGKAAKFLAASLSVPERTRDMIYDWMTTKDYVRNLNLIRLPLKGCPEFTIRRDRPNPEGWNKVVSEIGATSLMAATTPWGGNEEVF